jgi:lysophospholipase
MKQFTLAMGIMAAVYAVTDNTLAAPAAQPGSASQYRLTHEQQYDEVFERDIIPFWKRGEEGYFEGERGLKLHYRKFVNPEAKAGILLVHGYTESLVKYRELTYDLYRNGYSVYMYEHRGHGFSERMLAEKDVVYVDDFMNYVLDMNRFIDQHIMPQGQKLFLFAHSMGGGIAINYLQRYPDKVDGAALSSPMLDINTGGFPYWVAKGVARVGTLLGFGSKFAPGQSGADIKSWVINENQGDTNSQVRFSRYIKDIAQDSRLVLGGASYQWLNESFKYSEKAREKEHAATVSTPTLLLQAEHDTYVNPEGQNQYCTTAVNCRILKIPGSRHHSCMDVDAVRTPALTAVLQFYDELAARRRISSK